MRPTTQKNNARQRKTTAIVTVIAVVAIALAAVAPAFNGVKVSFLNYFAPVTSTFAPNLAYIWQIQETDRRHIAYMWQVIPEKPQLEGTKLPPNCLVSKTNCHI